MNQSFKSMTKGALLSGAIMLSLLSTPALAQIEIQLFPPVSFRATARPVYWEGHASYWYQGRWYYREGNDWRYYHEEPVHLREYRTNREPPRQNYERRHRGRW